MPQKLFEFKIDSSPHWHSCGWRQSPWSSKFYNSNGGGNQYSALSGFSVIGQQKISINDWFFLNS
jgi:hypothetical protein